jgi:hypothetical protein
MAVWQPRYSKGESGGHSDEIYETQVRAALRIPQGSQVEQGSNR